MKFDLNDVARRGGGIARLLAGEGQPNQPPIVNGVSINPNPILVDGSTTFSATGVQDTDGTVVGVEFFFDGNSIGTDTDPAGGYTIDFLPANDFAAGDYVVTAVATDDDGATTTVTNTLTITEPSPPPTPEGFIGPVEYLAFDDPAAGEAISPFAALDFDEFFLEDFEDGVLDQPGVSFVEADIVSYPSDGFTDSVDADDGMIDGDGRGGRYIRSNFATSSFTFNFDATHWQPADARRHRLDGRR